MALKYGRKPRTFKNIPHYSALVAGKKLTPIPAEIHYAASMNQNFGAMLNDQLGDCTCAGMGHARQVWTYNALNDERTTSDAYIQELYETVGGYVPGEPNTDQGCVEQDVLNYCLKTGAPIAEGAVNKLLGYFEVDPRNLDDVQRVIYECGLIYIGFNVPAYLENFETPGSVWDVHPAADNTIVGGHCVILPGYDATSSLGKLDVISWGAAYHMTLAFWNQFVDECYALVDQGWIDYSGKTPAGLTVTEIESQMQSLS